jgi:hypothetical protein
MTAQGYNFGGKKAELLKRRLAGVQVATDSGYGHRCVTHDRTNPYHPQNQVLEHQGWEAGWLKADRELKQAAR